MRFHPNTRRGRSDGERGAGLVEYAMLMALIALVVFSAVSFFGRETGGGFQKSTDCIGASYEDRIADECP